ncbi:MULTISPECIES: GNAT family N-acetyltransferase [Cytobacillus]|uniref:GNAT family N-acetyltransferase n=1 Tax=Cytobacillus TaxID=2675230 RepID=UPI0020404F2B|nr:MULTISPECIES: GNAT family N-acetyltransferase [Cytobacillus]MBY0155648.1 GNAT family N-acetyltransferase [Cytobacillus firmus]MCM3246725.1 GNAT family N-acetyltransferase [Cytobacillus oceanisediminis]MCS0823836.1 GNAT family N-acetyltransferase [Cytobacillus firmus]UQX55173.1 GNAT family N-acetyltransferase [Cytobacillus pseudoceanisediminis]
MEKVVEYKKLTIGDESSFSKLVLLFNNEFESPDLNYVNDKNIRSLIAKPDFICFVAFIGDEVVGGLTGYELLMYDQEGSSMYLYDLAVDKNYQRRGIGSNLVGELMEYCRSKDIKDLFVQADVEDQHAVEFYNKIGGDDSETVQFSFHL